MKRANWIGKTLGGRYKIEEVVGQGGMSAVYKAFDPNLKRVVAIKLIHSHLADDPKFLTRFEEEATAVAQLRHPHIVQVYDFNHDDDLYYMVQEFVPGETLQERMRRVHSAGKRLPLVQAIQHTIEICDAAGYAHQRGMIHRDIKPANIMLDVHDHAILMDFGIVKITGAERHTATGAVVGTALYMPPELIRGEPPDPRSDLYSLGVAMFEMVNGRPPFEADSAMTLMMMHLHDPIPDLHELRPEVPEDLIAVIGKALAKDRNQRYGSMAELASALRQVLDRIQGRTLLEATLVDQAQDDGSLALHEIPEATMVEATSAEFNTATVLEPAAEPSNPPTPTIKEAAVPGLGGEAGQPPAPPSPLATMGGPAPSSPQTKPVAKPKPGISKPIPALLIAGAVVLLLCAAGSAFAAIRLFGGVGNPASESGENPTSTGMVLAALAGTATPSPTITIAPTSTDTPLPTDTPTPTLSPTPTIPAGVPYVRINGITIDINGYYVAEYETFEFTESVPGIHVHFFFNTVPPDQAGRPGDGPWYLYGGPRPFNKFRLIDRPRAATQMCVLVANHDHSVQLNSGNCAILPDIVVAAPLQETTCLAGPGLSYPSIASLVAGQILLVQGISPDEGWWNVSNPQDADNTCWLPRDATSVSGDISKLQLVEAPPPTGPAGAAGLFVEITQVSIEDQDRYVVEYIAQGFDPQMPGIHIHFFFNNVPPEQVGISGEGFRLMYAGPTPFTGFTTADRPAEATQMCALVANPDHTVVLESGNCVDLPNE